MSIELELASIEDIVQELRGRGRLYFALLVDHALGEDHPPGDIPPEERIMVFTSAGFMEHPLKKAIFLCAGLILCVQSARRRGAEEEDAMELFDQVDALVKNFKALFDRLTEPK